MNYELIQLVKSLSPAEKRTFKLNSKKHSIAKAYVTLFDIIVKAPAGSKEYVETEFKKLHPSTSLESASQYLSEEIIDVLIKLRIRNDNQFRAYYGIMKAGLLFERSLFRQGCREIHKVREWASTSQDYLMQYRAIRMNLDYLSERSFENMVEQEVVQIQSEARNLLQLLRRIQEHHSLYELLEFRLIRSGRSLSEDDRKRMDDLVLSELNLISQQLQKSFESQKLHLLFQSFYFTHTGDYLSAIAIFDRLNKLFEDYQSLWGYPPYDYFDTLEGILDSLRAMRSYPEIDYYVRKVEQLSGYNYNEHFNMQCRLVVNSYRLLLLNQKEEWAAAESLIQQMDQNLIRNFDIPDSKRFLHLLFCVSSTWFYQEQWKKAGYYLDQIDLEIQQPSALLRSARLLRFIIHYELGNIDFLAYEIRNYKRRQKNRSALTKTEKLIFRIIKFDPNQKSRPHKDMYYQTVWPKTEGLKEDNYELQLLKYFDFTTWIIHSLKK